MTTFAAQVDDWVRQSNERMEAVFKTAVQSTANEVLNRTPVVTGTLKSSFQGSLTSFAPLTTKAAGKLVDPIPVQLVIAGAEIGDTIYMNYSMNYAVYVEHGARGRAGRGMVKLAAQNWQENVNKAVRAAKASVRN